MISEKAMGIIFPNMHDYNIPELVSHRTMGSMPFGGRYRMIDFPLSCMANAGIVNISVVARENYQSLMDHLESGREWDLARKRGGLVLFPPFSRDSGKLVRGRIPLLNSIMEYLMHRKEDVVVMSDCNCVYNIDFSALVDEHIKSSADVTTVYSNSTICSAMQGDNTTYTIDKSGRVTEVRINDYKEGLQCVSMNIYVLGRELLISIIKDSIVSNYTDLDRDFFSRRLSSLRLQAKEYTGYLSRIYDMKSYFTQNMRLLDPKSVVGLFKQGLPIRTKVRDEAPVRYGIASRVKNCLVADGCLVEGEVENCVLFRSVHVGKGAKLKNCVIGQGSIIDPDVNLEYIVTDKNVHVAEGQRLCGAESFPVFVAKNSIVN